MLGVSGMSVTGSGAASLALVVFVPLHSSPDGVELQEIPILSLRTILRDCSNSGTPLLAARVDGPEVICPQGCDPSDQ